MISRINGYDIQAALSIALNGDYSTSSSFEAPADVNPVFSHTWETGVVEYDLAATPTLAPRVFTISGYLSVPNELSYVITLDLLQRILYQNYVTVEDDSALAIKVNARLKPGSLKWTRKTPLAGRSKVVAEVGWQLDEVLQPMPFKDEGIRSLRYLADSKGRLYQTRTNKFILLK